MNWRVDGEGKDVVIVKYSLGRLNFFNKYILIELMVSNEIYLYKRLFNLKSKITFTFTKISKVI